MQICCFHCQKFPIFGSVPIKIPTSSGFLGVTDRLRPHPLHVESHLVKCQAKLVAGTELSTFGSSHGKPAKKNHLKQIRKRQLKVSKKIENA